MQKENRNGIEWVILEKDDHAELRENSHAELRDFSVIHLSNETESEGL